MTAKIVGAGLAGCEAAWQLARRGVRVTLYEMKPEEMSPAHKGRGFAELVCSNSLRAASVENAAGLLKAELRLMGGLVTEAADATQVSAGGALAVDREAFSQYVTAKIAGHENIEIVHRRIDKIPEGGCVIIATGPLTDGALAEDISALAGEALSFYDAAAPLVSFESVDMEKAFLASRYDKGTPDYINCPMDKDEYLRFWGALAAAEEAPMHGFEDRRVFEGCMPVEVMARRGEDALRFGPMKPVGLTDPSTGKRPYAVVQLRRDNAAGSVYNIVGFQTHLKFSEQKRVFSMIPGLERAEFLRFGVMHRNTYIDSPRLLNEFYEVKSRPGLYFAGQITGVEGYVESAASGLYAGGAAAHGLLFGKKPPSLSAGTACGALAAYISDGGVENFQPMNINFGIIKSRGGLEEGRPRGKKGGREAAAAAALEEVSASAFWSGAEGKGV